jgi:hypothetical protein
MASTWVCKILGPFQQILGLKYVLMHMWANEKNEIRFSYFKCMIFYLIMVRECRKTLSQSDCTYCKSGIRYWSIRRALVIFGLGSVRGVKKLQDILIICCFYSTMQGPSVEGQGPTNEWEEFVLGLGAWTVVNEFKFNRD